MIIEIQERTEGYVVSCKFSFGACVNQLLQSEREVKVLTQWCAKESIKPEQVIWLPQGAILRIKTMHL